MSRFSRRSDSSSSKAWASLPTSSVLSEAIRCWKSPWRAASVAATRRRTGCRVRRVKASDRKGAISTAARPESSTTSWMRRKVASCLRIEASSTVAPTGCPAASRSGDSRASHGSSSSVSSTSRGSEPEANLKELPRSRPPRAAASGGCKLASRVLATTRTPLASPATKATSPPLAAFTRLAAALVISKAVTMKPSTS